jgi:threonine dehydrogenase-like Zn-dependent dehydrogenase
MTTAELERPVTSAVTLGSASMKALVYHGPGKFAWENKPRPAIQKSADAIVRVTTSTICGTDLHILRGDLPAVTDGRILGHEAIGIVEQIGDGVSEFHVGDKVIVSCVTACLKCATSASGACTPTAGMADGFWDIPSTERRLSMCAFRKPMEVSTTFRRAPMKNRW